MMHAQDISQMNLSQLEKQVTSNKTLDSNVGKKILRVQLLVLSEKKSIYVRDNANNTFFTAISRTCGHSTFPNHVFF